MAIIENNGYKFYGEDNGKLESLIIQGFNLKKEMEQCKIYNIHSISLTYFETKNLENLDFLSDYPNITNVTIDDLDIDMSGIYNLEGLKSLTLSIKSKRQHLDYSKFKNLVYLSIDWYSDFPDLSSNSNLKELAIWKFKPKSKSFINLKLPQTLENFEITESNVLNFEGLNLFSLKKFEGHYCNALKSVEGIKGISINLKTLILDYCKKLIQYNDLGYCKQLDKIILGDCGDIPTLEWLKSLKNVKHFSFWNTNLTDGDTSPCFGIEYVSFKNAKHYNHKEEEFSK